MIVGIIHKFIVLQASWRLNIPGVVPSPQQTAFPAPAPPPGPTPPSWSLLVTNFLGLFLPHSESSLSPYLSLHLKTRDASPIKDPEASPNSSFRCGACPMAWGHRPSLQENNPQYVSSRCWYLTVAGPAETYTASWWRCTTFECKQMRASKEDSQRERGGNALRTSSPAPMLPHARTSAS
jgi:hypothetical protein